ncbi:MAG: hypothetical protein K6L74_16915 [Neptuniibacter sp.]
MSEENTIQVMVLDTIMLDGERIFPGDEGEVVLVDITPKDFAHLSKYKAVVEVGEITEVDDPDQDIEPSKKPSGDGNGDIGTSNGTGGTDAPPLNEAEATIDQIVEAIYTLKPEDYTKSGVPEVKALEAALKTSITAEQRDQAWTKYQDSEGSE